MNLDYENNRIIIYKISSGLKTILKEIKYDLFQKQWYRVHIQLNKGKMKIYIYKEDKFYFKQGKYNDNELKLISNLKPLIEVYDGSIKYGKIGWKCSACGGILVTSVKKVNDTCEYNPSNDV